MKRYIIIIILALGLTSCFDEDGYVIEPIPIQEVKIPYSMYEYQTYFKISSSEIVAHNLYSDWDLGFESTENGWHIILNSSRFMYAGNTGLSDFEAINTNLADTMIFDASSGNLDSTAIDNWADFSDPQNPVFPKNVYIINRGKDEEGNNFGFKKIVFEKLEGNSYYLRYSNFDNTDEHTFQIVKNPDVNFVLFSFDNGGNMTTQQPEKSTWDLCFTKYTSILFDDFGVPTPYLLRGVLINQSGIQVAKITNKLFKDISIFDESNWLFSLKQDAIGYDWKTYENDSYLIETKFSYVIKDRDNIYYKLRFTSFYNSIQGDPNYGEKGFPSVEIQNLTIN
jgi:hypothetical protein